MKSKNIVKTILVCAVLFSAETKAQVGSFEKVGTTSFQFLRVMPGARSTAMGEAYVSVVNNSEAVFWNPAALTRVAKFDASLSYSDWLLDVSLNSFSLAYSIPSLGTLGFQSIIVDMGEIEETRADFLFRDPATGVYNPGLTGETISPSSQAFGLSFAREVTDKFAFGLTAKYIREDLVRESASSVAFDGGVTYRTGFRSLEMAASLRNFSREVTFADRGYPLPQTFTIGVSGFIMAPQNSFFMQSDNSRLLVAYDLSQTRDNSQQQQIGFEYSLTDVLFLRGGYKANYDEEGLALGFGLKVSSYRVDYSYNDFGEFFDAVHRFTIGFVRK